MCYFNIPCGGCNNHSLLNDRFRCLCVLAALCLTSGLVHREKDLSSVLLPQLNTGESTVDQSFTYNGYHDSTWVLIKDKA